jgi:acyl-coenzyme A thioesterase PaaI-like protein
MEMTMANDLDGFEVFGDPGGFVHRNGPLHIRRGVKSIVKLRLAAQHTNSIGIASGGLLMTLLDIAMGASASAAVGYAGICPTVQFTCNLIAAGRLDDELVGEADITQVTRSLVFATARLTANGRVAATASGVFKVPSAAQRQGDLAKQQPAGGLRQRGSEGGIP